MGYGSGVLTAYYVLYIVRGLTVGIAGTSSHYISRQTGLPQNLLVASRGLGLIVGPILCTPVISKLIWSGNALVGVAVCLLAKAVCQAAIPSLETAWMLYAALFIIGLCMAVLDTTCGTLVSRIHGATNSGKFFGTYATLYGVGCMLAPFVTVARPDKAWYLLAVLDGLVFCVITSKRVRSGKPRDWKEKIRGTSPASSPDASSGADAPVSKTGPPPRVVRAGVAFTCINQAAMTAVSCWAFSYAITVAQLPEQVAASIPGAFYLAMTLARVAMVFCTSWLSPSSFMHIGAVLALGCAALFWFLDVYVFEPIANGGADSEKVPAALYAPLLLICFALMGVGFCPHYSQMLAAMQRHGDLDARVHGLYGTSTSLGITLGMWLPGLFSLPRVELLGSLFLFLIINACERDFPWRTREFVVDIGMKPGLEEIGDLQEVEEDKWDCSERPVFQPLDLENQNAPAMKTKSPEICRRRKYNPRHPHTAHTRRARG